MQALSPGVRTLVERLHAVAVEPERFWSRNRADHTRRLAELAGEIAASGEWAAIPHLMPLALGQPARVAASVVDAIESLSTRVPLGGVIQLDRRLRAASSWDASTWYRITPDQLAKLATGTAGPTLIQLAMCHPSGFVREASIRLAIVASDAREVRFLVVRLNDWVAQVRRAAAEALRARLTTHSSRELVAALPILDAAPRWARVGSESILDEIEGFLRSGAAHAAISEAMRSPDRFIRRSAFRRAILSTIHERTAVLRTALADSDASVRVWATRRIDPNDAAAASDLTAKMMLDPVGPIRIRGLELALDQGIDVDLEQLLVDAYAGIRTLAQAALLAREVDVVARYRAFVDSSQGRRLAAALAGLAEAGGEAVAPLVRPFLDHPSAAVRRAALHTLAALHADDVVELCLRALVDIAPQVTHAARDHLVRRAAKVDPASVWRAVQDSAAIHGRLDAVAVLGKLDYWQQLPHLLDATRFADVRSRATVELTGWIADRPRRFSQPTAATNRAIRAALREAELTPALRGPLAQALPPSPG